MKSKKTCSICSTSANALFRCRYNYKKEWGFLCQQCLAIVKAKYSKSYQYGGTKKIK
ncbi:MAG: hypothetical protein ISQ60_04500 [Gammaproteobacteria bacterium]|nr:hypothetical protein [Gammaproteobacteria bacterium]